MSKIDELQAELLDIEEQAGQVDPTDYEALYKLLAPAYFKAKDIIELSSGANPVAQEPVDDTELVAANVKISELTARASIENKLYIGLKESLRDLLNNAE